jgi:hypothetical protein
MVETARPQASSSNSPPTFHDLKSRLEGMLHAKPASAPVAITASSGSRAAAAPAPQQQHLLGGSLHSSSLPKPKRAVRFAHEVVELGPDSQKPGSPTRTSSSSSGSADGGGGAWGQDASISRMASAPPAPAGGIKAAPAAGLRRVASEADVMRLAPGADEQAKVHERAGRRAGGRAHAPAVYLAARPSSFRTHACKIAMNSTPPGRPAPLKARGPLGSNGPARRRAIPPPPLVISPRFTARPDRRSRPLPPAADGGGGAAADGATAAGGSAPGTALLLSAGRPGQSALPAAAHAAGAAARGQGRRAAAVAAAAGAAAAALGLRLSFGFLYGLCLVRVLRDHQTCQQHTCEAGSFCSSDWLC